MAKSNRLKFKKRNYLHDHPLMRKCSVHDKTHKQKRGKVKITIKRESFDQSAGVCVLMKVFF